MSWSRGRALVSPLWTRAVKAAAGCCQLGYPGCTGAVDQADHIIPVAEGGDPYALTNGQGVCASCHAVKSSEEATRGRVRLYSRARRIPRKHPAEV